MKPLIKSIFPILSLLFIVLIGVSCKKDKKEDPRLKYVGQWNFKSNSYSFSGYYDYSGQTPVWTYSESSSTGYNDSTGSISLGSSENELIIRYCNTCQSEVFNLNENGEGSWTLTESTFFNDIQPAPPGYTSAYSTYNIEGWKL